MDGPIWLTFQGNTLALFSVPSRWKSLTTDIWQPESISWFGAGAGLTGTLHRRNSKALLDAITLVIWWFLLPDQGTIQYKKCRRIIHGLCTELMGEGEEHKRRLLDIFSWCRANDSSRWNSIQQRKDHN